MSLYGDYIKEKLGRGILETEQGWISFDFIGKDVVYVADMYVVPEHRRSKVGTELVNKVVEEVIKLDRKILMSSVDVTSKDALISLRGMEAYGMKIYSVQGTVVYFVKPISVEVPYHGGHSE